MKSLISFIITGYDKPNNLTDILGVIPSKTWMKGDLKIKNCLIKHKSNGWELSLKKSNIIDIDTLLKKLISDLNKIKNKINKINKIKKEFKVVIYYTKSVPSIFYDLEIISFLNDINATIDHDIYLIKNN